MSGLRIDFRRTESKARTKELVILNLIQNLLL